jgi:hypothetical protein
VTIETSDTVDIVAFRPQGGVVELCITDHLDWSDATRHATLIQDKVNAYLDFVESGQLGEVQTPGFPARVRVTIVVACLHEPPSTSDSFFNRLEEALQKFGIGLEVSTGKPLATRRFTAPSKWFDVRT